MLRVDRVAQSFVDLDDPTHLNFEYLRYVRQVINSIPEGKVDTLHVGGGGFTIARYLAHARPGSRQVGLEPSAEIVDLVRERLGLDDVPQLTVLVRDGLTGVNQSPDEDFDLVVLDAYDGPNVPPELTTAEFFAETRRVLRPGGTLVANFADGPSTKFVGPIIKTIRETFPHVLALGDQAVTERRVYGHIIIAASADPALITRVTEHLARQGTTRITCLPDKELDALIP